MLAQLEQILRGETPPPPIAQLLAIRLISVEPGEATFEMNVDGRYANPMGTLHGGILCDLADIAMGSSFASMLAPGESFTTLELKINFLKAVRTGRLRATGRVIKAGRTIGLIECDVLDEREDLVARASSTCMRLRSGEAAGR
ncbi:MAG TPA: PaaI family thioesterase [Dehalococcoidia bacterium]|nr:PaaI family thioesterase [Dehalococcoidia bacterium]